MHRKFNIRQWSSILLLVGLVGCGKQDEDAPPLSVPAISEYVLLDAGWFAEYSVEQIRYTAAFVGIPDSSHFFRRYEADACLTLQNQIKALKVNRFHRADSSNPWVQDSSFLFWQEPSGIYQTAGAQVFLVFPAVVRPGIQWNRNIRNQIGPNTSTLTGFAETRTVANVRYDNTHFVQIDRIPRNFVNVKDVYQVYARGIGRVLSYSEDVAYAQGPLFGQRIPESGLILKETMTQFGSLP